MSLLSRINLKILWLKKTYPFIWAHKPLCEHFREDVTQIKGVFLCRSCLCAYLGIGLGLCLAPVLRVFHPGLSPALLIALLCLTVPLSYPTLYKRLHRRYRDGIRLTAGMILPLLFLTLIEGYYVLFFTTLLFSFFFWKFYYSRRAKRKIEFCQGCKEYTETGICSGYTLQAALIRTYEEEATKYIVNSGYIPRVLKK